MPGALHDLKIDPSLPVVKVGVYNIAPFKHNIPPYGAFANTTPAGDYPVPQVKNNVNYNWPSSEHAFHAQKLFAYRDTLAKENPGNTAKITQVDKVLKVLEAAHGTGTEPFGPSNFKMLIDTNLGQAPVSMASEMFNSGLKNGGAYSHNDKSAFMETVIDLKFENNPALKEMAMEFSRRGIMPVEVSQHDSKWAAGVDGNGLNLLGIAILKLGNKYLIANGEKPKIQNPASYYTTIKQVAGAPSQLAHDALAVYDGVGKKGFNLQSGLPSGQTPMNGSVLPEPTIAPTTIPRQSQQPQTKPASATQIKPLAITVAASPKPVVDNWLDKFNTAVRHDFDIISGKEPNTCGYNKKMGTPQTAVTVITKEPCKLSSNNDAAIPNMVTLAKEMAKVHGFSPQNPGVITVNAGSQAEVKMMLAELIVQAPSHLKIDIGTDVVIDQATRQIVHKYNKEIDEAATGQINRRIGVYPLRSSIQANEQPLAGLVTNAPAKTPVVPEPDATRWRKP